MLISILAGIVTIPTSVNNHRFSCLLHAEHRLMPKKAPTIEINVIRSLLPNHETMVVIMRMTITSFISILSFIKNILSLL